MCIRDSSTEVLKEAVETPVEWGAEYPWPSVTAMTYGLRSKEMIVFGAGTGVGKTEFFKEMEVHLLNEGHTVGCVHLEESPKDTCLGLMNKVAGRTFHIPESGWTNEERDDAFTKTVGTGRVLVYDAFGAISYERVESKIRYMVKGLGCKFVFLDHLTALTDGETQASNVNQQVRNNISALASLTRELDFTLIAISHLRKADGKCHEEGGRVHLDDLSGSGALKQWPSFVFGLERDQQAECEEERHTTTLRVLKDRYTGRALGRTIRVRFERETTRLIEEEGGEF
jgi:twinkle protein